MAAPTPEVDRVGRLHRGVVVEPAAIRTLLARLIDGPGLGFTGLDARAEVGHARVLRVDDRAALLSAPGLRFARQPQVYFQFELDGGHYFFAARPRREDRAAKAPDDDRLVIDLPAAIYASERRLAHRRAPDAGAPRRVEIAADGSAVTAQVRDWSEQGLGIALPRRDAAHLKFPARVRYLDGDRRGAEAWAALRNRADGPDADRWVRLGLALSAVPFGPEVPVERPSPGQFETGSRWQTLPLAKAPASDEAEPVAPRPVAERRDGVEILDYRNDRGEPIRAIVNTTGDVRGATAVVIPPSWGRTKERTLPLAATLIETFERAGEPLAVVRFDGTHRSGESWVAPSFRKPGDEYLGFTFSQAARDIQATFDFLEHDARFASKKIVLVTFSLGAVEGRRAVAQCPSSALAGWVSVVGMADLQSGLRTVSGGVDYGHGLSRGVRFGVQELVGVVADMDYTGLDAIENGMMFYEDARRDMAGIHLPVTWLHGSDDAWMDLRRVQQLMSTGDTSGRRLVEIPCGHQVRTSREASSTFRLVAGEVSQMALGRRLPAADPDVRSYLRVEKAERERIAGEAPDLRSFWRNYLLGDEKGQSVGIELMTATRAYGEFMALQLRELDVAPGQCVVDLGAGVGDFTLALSQDAPAGVRVFAVDLLPEALRRGRARLGAARSRAGEDDRSDGPSLLPLAADLDLGPHPHVPLADASADRVIASLVVSYLDDPAALLAEARRILRPGGRLVVSTLRRDADISKLYVDGLAELLPDRMKAHFGSLPADTVEDLQRRFLNNASRLLTLEESGDFRFWDADEFAALAARAGFRDVVTHHSFGHPPQAIILRAVAD